MLAQNYTSPPYIFDDNHSPRPAHSFYPQYLDDLDAISLDDHSLASSLSIPRHLNVDGRLYLSQSSSPRASPGDQLPTPQQYHLDPMQSESSWFAGGQYVPKSVGRLSHHRESSLSSLGSAGPASPYSHNTANPQIAVTDSGSDGFSDMPSHDNSYYQLAKTMGSGHDSLYASYSPFGGDAQGVGSGYHAMGAAHRFKGDRSLLPAPELSSPFGPNRSHPASVASSIAGDSPATPSLGEPEDDRRRKTILTNVPKLDRTMTDVYSDELYNPNFSITSATSPHVQIPMSPQHDVFTQRLQAANSQHLTAAGHSPVSTSSRSRSPFRQGSPLAPAPAHDFGASAASNRLRYNTAQQMRDQQKAEQDAQARQRMSMKTEPETPKTISPKDAILEFHEPEGDANFPLFPPQDTFLYDHMPKAEISHVDNDGYHRSSSASTGSDFRFASAQLPASIQVPQQYPFIAHSRLLQDSPPRLSSTDSSSTGSPGSMAKPLGTIADGGTYTCTYHGCTLRFDSPALLQKHKREGHRQAQGLSSPTHQPELGVPASLMTQAGPHRCDRINPSTGKPCSTVFSRPYDLTRHEDTIHNARKLKVRCNLCTEEKTFSRADALTRHYRVCHPDVEFPGKHRRRGGH